MLRNRKLFVYLSLSENVRSTKNVIMKNKRLILILAIVVTILLIPLIAMQFTDEVNWNLLDFVVAGALLLGAGLMYEFVIRKINTSTYRIAAFIVLLVVFLLVWAELAVGIFGTALAGQ